MNRGSALACAKAGFGVISKTLDGSRSLVNRASLLIAFTIMLPTVAHADRVAFYPVGGRADDSRIEAVEESLAAILREQGHTLAPPASAARPTQSAAAAAAAAGANANYVVVADVDPLPGQYRLHVYCYYRPAGRMEEILVDVLLAQEQERLRDVIRSMVRPDGLGEDAVRLTGVMETPEQRAAREAEERRLREAAEAEQRTQQEAEEERRRREAEEAAQREEAERRTQEEHDRELAANRAQNAWNDRVRYGNDGTWMVQLTTSGHYLGALTRTCAPTAPTSCQSGGGLFDIGARVGYRIAAVEGLEVRGGFDFITGTTTALDLRAGIAWLGSFFTEPIYIGGMAELGAFFGLTGARNVMFVANLAPVIAWRPIPHLYIEIAAPQLGLLASSASALTIGGGLSVGYRF
jgi:hypothetical protein